jgi:hypothetical protein
LDSTRGFFILLVILPRHDLPLYQYLARRLSGVEGAQIILDRRHGQRRRATQPAAVERRSGVERRQGLAEERFSGYTFVRLD